MGKVITVKRISFIFYVYLFQFRPEDLLGELQVAFVCFLVGQVYGAFEQWKNLVHVICSADEMLLKNPKFFIGFIEDLYFQVSLNLYFYLPLFHIVFFPSQ